MVDALGLTVLVALALTVLVALATFGIVEYLVNQNGPGDILKELRYLMGVNQPLNHATNGGFETEYVSNGSFLGDLFGCPYCLTPWVSFLVAGLTLLVTPVVWFLPIWLAAIGLTAFLFRASGK
jgi:hypothetical protein